MKIKEKLFGLALFISALVSVFTTISIIVILFHETIGFFKKVSFIDFILKPQWKPLYAKPEYGIAPLVCGTFLTSIIAIILAIVFGMSIAIYLSEYLSVKVREVVKPILEILAGIPSVIYGYFALTVVTPFLKNFIPNLEGFNALSPGIVMGIMIVPYISSLSEDAMHSVPMLLRESSYAMGATKLQTIFRVVIPSASSGIISSFILGFSRALGETMIVAIAAGMTPALTLNPLRSVQTITAYIVQVCLGDVSYGGIEYKTIFCAGASLFLITFLFNMLAFSIKKKYG